MRGLTLRVLAFAHILSSSKGVLPAPCALQGSAEIDQELIACHAAAVRRLVPCNRFAVHPCAQRRISSVADGTVPISFAVRHSITRQPAPGSDRTATTCLAISSEQPRPSAMRRSWRGGQPPRMSARHLAVAAQAAQWLPRQVP